MGTKHVVSISLFPYTGGRTSEILRNKYLKTVAKLKVIPRILGNDAD